MALKMTDKEAREFARWKKRNASKPTTKELEEESVLKKKCLQLWARKVKEHAGNSCEVDGCKQKKFLNSHHIESFISNKGLRFEVRNGICLCPRHHRFGWHSAHRSFCFLYQLLFKKRKDDLEFLLNNYQNRIKLDKVFLLNKIKELENEL